MRNYFRVEFADRPPCYMSTPEDSLLYLDGIAGARFAVSIDEDEYIRNTTPPNYDWDITVMYVDVFKEPPVGLSIKQQLMAIFELFDDYRHEFGEIDEVRCEKCHNFFDEFGGCLYCDEDDDE